MYKIGYMLWRIGPWLDVYEQLAWVRQADSEGVGLHASAGVPGQWRGVDPATCSVEERRRLCEALAPFTFREIHAPFRVDLHTETLQSDIAVLEPVLALAGDVEAGIVTVHAQLPTEDTELRQWLGPMQALNRRAAQAQTVVALEITREFDAVMGWGLSHVAVNLDVGHMYLPAHAAMREQCGGIGGLIRHLGSVLVHLHVHDVVGNVDHIEVGTGGVDWQDMIAALHDIGYARGLCLELNPDRVSPEGMHRSKEYLRCLRDR
jgi:sugar phosphate isomerase/epimerase